MLSRIYLRLIWIKSAPFAKFFLTNLCIFLRVLCGSEHFVPEKLKVVNFRKWKSILFGIALILNRMLWSLLKKCKCYFIQCPIKGRERKKSLNMTLNLIKIRMPKWNNVYILQSNLFFYSSLVRYRVYFCRNFYSNFLVLLSRCFPLLYAEVLSIAWVLGHTNLF